jgi:hypothetical protein
MASSTYYEVEGRSYERRDVAERVARRRANIIKKPVDVKLITPRDPHGKVVSTREPTR